MSQNWTPVTDVSSWLRQKGKKVRHDGHALTKRVLHWPYCVRCGHIALKNEASRKHKCETEE